MQKYRDAEIKSFEFTDLKGTHVITKGEFEAFSFKTLTGESATSHKPSEEALRSERALEAKNDFKIDEIVRDYRGLSRQEKNDLEQKIQEEVKKRLETAYQEAYSEGLEKGRIAGEEKAAVELAAIIELKTEEFAQVISDVRSQSESMINSNKADIYEFVKRFSKWIVLKEINEKVYLESLLEKLILELNARKNLIVKVGRENFSQMPEVIKAVESRLGQLSNIRIEIVPELHHPGIILESENGLIDGSLEGVFQNIDKIFEQVVGHE